MVPLPKQIWHPAVANSEELATLATTSTRNPARLVALHPAPQQIKHATLEKRTRGTSTHRTNETLEKRDAERTPIPPPPFIPGILCPNVYANGALVGTEACGPYGPNHGADYF